MDFHLIFAAMMTSWFASNAVLEFRHRNKGLGWYDLMFAAIGLIYFWALILWGTK